MAIKKDTHEPPSGSAAGQSHQFIVPLDKFEIVSSSPEPAIDGWGGRIFAARRNGQTKTDCIAVLGTKVDLFRLETIQSLHDMKNEAMLNVLAWGVVDWPVENRQLMALIYDRPATPLLKNIDDKHAHFSENDVTTRVLTPLTKLLTLFEKQSLVHGAIRPTNLFQDATGRIVLGDCVSTRPLEKQLPQFLTIESAMTEPMGRGSGEPSDDIYALGVTLISLILGHVPLHGLKVPEIIRLKIERGSYAVLSGKHRFSSGFMELLQGMLLDDADQRWDLAKIQHWLSGRRFVSGQPLHSAKPVRPITVGGVDCLDPRSLAETIGRHVPETLKLIEGNVIGHWLRRVAHDEAAALRAANEFAAATTGQLYTHDVIIARVAMAIDQKAPMRYKGAAVMPSGLGAALANTLLTGTDPEIYADMIAAHLPLAWANNRASSKRKYTEMIAEFERLRIMLTRRIPGLGLERCLYELMPFVPYLGPGYETYYITGSREFILALEARCGSKNPPAILVDAHGAAFLAVRDRGLGERAVNKLTMADSDAKKALAKLYILAGVQRRHNIPSLPRLCHQMVTILQPAIAMLHHRPTRKRLNAQLSEAAADGDLSNLLFSMEDKSLFDHDRENFSEARRIYSLLSIDKIAVEKEISPQATLYRSAGHDIAGIVTAIVATIAALAIILVRVTS